MESYNEYILEWKKWVLKENEALQSGDYDKAAEYNMLASEAYKKYRQDTQLSYEMENKTFGEFKKILENNIFNLFKTKSSLLKEYKELIKEDKNIKAQHDFYSVLENYQEGNDAKDYINEALNLVSQKIDYKTIKESNNKINTLLVKYRNILENEIDENYSKVCESCNYILTHKKKITNLNEINNNISVISKYINENPKKNITENVDTLKLISNFDNKLKTTLNEEEKTFVQEIMDAKKNSDNNKQKKLFNKFKNECLTHINKLISESSDTEKEQLLNIKEQILNKEFCVETLVKDMAKLLEIRDVLMS